MIFLKRFRHVLIIGHIILYYLYDELKQHEQTLEQKSNKFSIKVLTTPNL